MNIKTAAVVLALAALLAGVASGAASTHEPKSSDVAIYDGSAWLKSPARPPVPR